MDKQTVRNLEVGDKLTAINVIDNTNFEVDSNYILSKKYNEFGTYLINGVTVSENFLMDNFEVYEEIQPITNFTFLDIPMTQENLTSGVTLINVRKKRYFTLGKTYKILRSITRFIVNDDDGDLTYLDYSTSANHFRISSQVSQQDKELVLKMNEQVKQLKQCKAEYDRNLSLLGYGTEVVLLTTEGEIRSYADSNVDYYDSNC